ncbi:MAG: hypothetical protein GEU75_09235 [Dehalococcoidia bacterium]|nr:hypothetical protein [Dehalococcoidia bacterium]
MNAQTPAHICSQCGATFPTEAQLREHVSSAHRQPQNR